MNSRPLKISSAGDEGNTWGYNFSIIKQAPKDNVDTNTNKIKSIQTEEKHGELDEYSRTLKNARKQGTKLRFPKSAIKNNPLRFRPYNRENLEIEKKEQTEGELTERCWKGYTKKGMKIVISESQYKRLIETEEEQKVLHVPSLKFFNDDWDLLQKFLKLKGNPLYSIGGDLYLEGTRIESLGNLQSVGGSLYLGYTPIQSLGNLQSVGGYLNLYKNPIKSLGNLTSVGGDLNLFQTPIKSLGNLQSVGGNLRLGNTPISEKYSEEEIRQMVNVDGGIYL